MAIRVFHRDDPSAIVPLISNDARLVIWLGVGAETANMNFVVMEPDEANTPHAHEASDDTIFILEGVGTVEDLTNDTRLEFGAGDVINVPAGVTHAVLANRGARVVSVGGPCPADPGLLKAAGLSTNIP